VTTSEYFSGAKALRRLHEGPLGTQVDLCAAARLLNDGSPSSGAASQRRVPDGVCLSVKPVSCIILTNC
jgi:hypothetical protein